jgi:hypothetical protein
MSFDAPNILSVQAASAVARAEPARTPQGPPPAAPPAADESVTIDTMPSTPPPEVLDAIGEAARAYDRLTANGVQLHFHVDEQTGKVGVHVYDMQGTVLGSLAPSQVLDIATSGTLD